MAKFMRWLVVLCVVAGAAGGIWYTSQPEPLEVSVRAVELGTVERTVANTRAGTVKACRRARLATGIGGQIAFLRVKEGEKVKAGQILLELWNDDLAAELTLAQSEAEAAGASAQAICLQSEVAQREADRLVRLRASGVASEEQTDRAVTEAKAARADCKAAVANANVSAARIGVVQANLARTRLVAPFDGVVAEITGELNEYVTPSPPGIPTPPAVDLIDDSCFSVEAPIDEVDAPEIRVGMPARISLDAFPGRDFPARVRRIDAYVLDVEKQARTVDVEVEFQESADLEGLLAGYTADVEVILEVREHVLRIPTESVLDERRVFVLLPSKGVLRERVIRPGISNWDHTEVEQGLTEGEQVVVSLDQEGIEDGAAAVVGDAGQ